MKLTWISISILFVGIAYAQTEKETQPPRETFMEEMNTSMKVMDHDMAAAPMTGDADHDFAAMMIPHHQGAIDMAKAELIYGKDPVMRRLAQEIIVDQKSEIDVMNLWLGKNAKAGKGR